MWTVSFAQCRDGQSPGLRRNMRNPVPFSMDVITHLTFRTMARNTRSSNFGETYPGISDRTLTSPGKMSLITLITPAGVHPPWQMVWKTSTTPGKLWSSIVDVCHHDNKPCSLIDTCMAARSNMHYSTQHHTRACLLHGWQTPCTLWLISWKDVACDLACTF